MVARCHRISIRIPTSALLVQAPRRHRDRARAVRHAVPRLSAGKRRPSARCGNAGIVPRSPDWPSGIFSTQRRRVRRFGGGTNLDRGGWTRAMDPIDSRHGPGCRTVGGRSRGGSRPLPDRARALLNVAPPADAMRDATGRGGRHVSPLPPDRIETGLLQFSPIIDFSAAYKEALFAAANVQTMLYANVTAITTTPGGAAAVNG